MSYMRLKDVVDYYSREDIQKALLRTAKDREVVGVFRNGSFSKRPNTIIYPQDIVSMMRQGVVEFHCSLEWWSQPMARAAWMQAVSHGGRRSSGICDAAEIH